VIYAVNGQAVLDLDRLRAALGSLDGKRAAILQVERDGVLRYVAVPLD
jgi:S1-C subfamily serine protease